MTFEFEDVAAALLDAVVVAPEVPDGELGWRAWRLQAAARMVARGSARRPTELVLAVGQSPQDLVPGYAVAEQVRGAATSLAYVHEVYPSDLPLQRDVLAYLDLFDHVFVGVAATVPLLDTALSGAVHYLPAALDVAASTAGPDPLRRISWYAMGRRNPVHHELLRARAERTGELYLYDTFAGNPPVKGNHAHRENLRGLIRRTDVFLVNVARMNEPGRVQGLSEIGFRYAEGAAGGAVLVGQRPTVPAFAELFDWPDVVVEVDPDGSDLEAVLDELAADDERRQRIRRANVAGALRGHDVAHRVATMLTTAGAEVPAAVDARRQLLEERARELAPATLG